MVEIIKRYETMLSEDGNLFFEVETYERIIEHYIQLGKLQNAFHACNQGIDQHPNAVDLYQEKARILIDFGKIDEAIALLDSVLSFHPNDYECQLIKSTALSMTQRHKEALDILNHILAQGLNQDEILYNLALTYQSMGDFTQAVTHFKKTLIANPKHEHAVSELIKCLDFIEKLPEAVTYFEKLIDQDPYHHMAWYHLGTVYKSMNRLGDALKAFDYAVLIEKDFEEALFEMGKTYLAMKKYLEARTYFEKVINLRELPTPDLLCQLALSYEKLGLTKVAYSYYLQASKIDHYCAEAWYGMGVCLESDGKWNEAHIAISRARKINPKQASYWVSLARLDQMIGNILSAIESYENAATLAPYDEEIWLNWSYLYYEEADYDKAIDILHNVLDDFPENTTFLYRLVCYQLEGGKYKEAFNTLGTALLLDYDGHEVLYDFFDGLETQKALFKVIDQYRPE